MKVFLRFQFDPKKSLWIGELGEEERVELSQQEFQTMASQILAVKVPAGATCDLTICHVTFKGVDSVQVARIKDYISMLVKG